MKLLCYVALFTIGSNVAFCNGNADLNKCEEKCFIEYSVCEQDSNLACANDLATCGLQCDNALELGEIEAEEEVDCRNNCDDNHHDCVDEEIGKCIDIQEGCVETCNTTYANATVSNNTNIIDEMTDDEPKNATKVCMDKCDETFSACEEVACDKEHGTCAQTCFSSFDATATSTGNVTEEEYVASCIQTCDEKACLDMEMDHCFGDQDICISNCTSADGGNVTGAGCMEQCSNIFDSCCTDSNSACIVDCQEQYVNQTITVEEYGDCITAQCDYVFTDCQTNSTGECALLRNECAQMAAQMCCWRWK